MGITLFRPRTLFSTGSDWDEWFDDFFRTETITPSPDFDLGCLPAVEGYMKGNELHVRAKYPGLIPRT
jgi:hypothetical protein